MKANFRTGIGQGMFGGALLYHLQGEEGTSISTQLLVIWGYNSDGIYLHVWLIEHESTLIWGEDELKKLYHVYNSRYDPILSTSYKEWLLDNNTMLEIVRILSHGGFKMEIIISEKRQLSLPRKPLWIDSSR
jgi:hypothetical protein